MSSTERQSHTGLERGSRPQSPGLDQPVMFGRRRGMQRSQEHVGGSPGGSVGRHSCSEALAVLDGYGYG